jgi:MFS family permease
VTRTRLGSVVVVLCAVNLLVAADFLGASVLLDPIGRDLHMGTATLAWVVNGYLLTLAAPLIAFGRAADAVGAVRLTRLGLLAFAVGAAVTGVAGSEEVLIAGRMVQGVGASILTATGLSLVSTAAAPGERGRVVGIWAGVGAVGSAAGPLLAGALEALGSWRIFFLVDVPFALVVLWFLRDARDAERSAAPAAVDVVGVVCLTLGLGGAVLALLAGPDSGWGSVPVVGGGIGAVALLTVFAVRDARATHPLLDRRLFGGYRYRAVATAAFVGNVAFAVVAFFASLYLQQVQDLDPVAAGAVFLAMTVPLIALSPRVGAWSERFAVGRLMAGGLVIVAISVVLFAGLGVDDGLGPVIVALVLSGAGQALVFNVSNIAAVDAAVGAAGLESGMINEVRQIGALVGLAGFGALFAALQAAGHGSAASVFVAALRLPNLILAGGCVLAAAYVVRARQDGSSAPG